MLSDYQWKIDNRNDIPMGKVKKPVADFFDKEKYVFHYKNLQLYLRLELNLKNTWTYGKNYILNLIHNK